MPSIMPIVGFGRHRRRSIRPTNGPISVGRGGLITGNSRIHFTSACETKNSRSALRKTTAPTPSSTSSSGTSRARSRNIAWSNRFTGGWSIVTQATRFATWTRIVCNPS